LKQTVVLTAVLPDTALAILSRNFDVVEHENQGIRSENDLIDLLVEADGAITLLTDPVTRRVLQSNPHLRVVANCAVGTDNIDLPAAAELGVVVTNTPGILTEDTADLTMAMVLGITRRLVEGDHFLRQGRFRGWQPLLLRGMSLGGKRLGIVGMGRIGSAVAERALAFGMEPVYVSRTAHEGVARRVDLPELLTTSDVVSLHCPLTPQTRHLIGERELRSMKSTAYLVNTARGALVDEAALASVLESGHLRGAALDVFENEPAVEPRLFALENVILLPHMGSATEKTRDEMARMAAMDVTRVLNGGTALYPVTA
jgi:glyoxylate reductase